MGTTQSSQRVSVTQIQVQNAEYSPTEQFVGKEKPLFKKINQKLPQEDGKGDNNGQNETSSKCKVEMNLEQVSISEHEVNAL